MQTHQQHNVDTDTDADMDRCKSAFTVTGQAMARIIDAEYTMFTVSNSQ